LYKHFDEIDRFKALMSGKKAIVNTKALYAAGAGIAVAAIAIFFVMGPGNIRLPGGQQTAPLPLADLQLDLKEINVQKIDDRNANVQVVFTTYNPNRVTAILETIHYTLHVGEFQMTSGDIGVSPEGFVGSQAGTFTVIANSTVTLKDTQVAVRNNLTADSWDNMVEGDAQYRVDGNYIYRITGGNFETTPGEKEFSLTFP
jgi:LEA14-like dessication related protein